MSAAGFVCALVAVSAQLLRLQSMLGLVCDLQSVPEVHALCYCGFLRVLNSYGAGDDSTCKFFE